MKALPLHSILDNDFYKFTMQYAVVKLFPQARARYRFINRGEHRFAPGAAQMLQEAVRKMADLQLTVYEKDFLSKTCPYLDPAYLDFLQGYRYDPSEVTIRQEGSSMEISVEGYWYRTILWEVPLLSLVSECFYLVNGLTREDDEVVVARAKTKMEKFSQLDIKLADFGTRRRHSYAVQDLVVKTMSTFSGKGFTGTSNVHLAMKYDLKPIGTHAHEWFMFHAAKYGFKMANIVGLEHWVDVFRGDLGIALSDTYTTDVFFRQFDKKFAKLFDGVRHDSGDPLLFADKTIRHYESLGINPLFKTIIFSDGLNYEKVAAILEHCKGRIGVSFGIGTNLTNDVGLTPMNIVLKMTESQPEYMDWTPVVKLSDEKGKYTGSEEMISLAKKMLDIEE